MEFIPPLLQTFVLVRLLRRLLLGVVAPVFGRNRNANLLSVWDWHWIVLSTIWYITKHPLCGWNIQYAKHNKFEVSWKESITAFDYTDTQIHWFDSESDLSLTGPGIFYMPSWKNLNDARHILLFKWIQDEACDTRRFWVVNSNAGPIFLSFLGYVVQCLSYQYCIQYIWSLLCYKCTYKGKCFVCILPVVRVQFVCYLIFCPFTDYASSMTTPSIVNKFSEMTSSSNIADVTVSGSNSGTNIPMISAITCVVGALAVIASCLCWRWRRSSKVKQANVGSRQLYPSGRACMTEILHTRPVLSCNHIPIQINYILSVFKLNHGFQGVAVTSIWLAARVWTSHWRVYF